MSQEKENRSKEAKQGITHSATLFFRKPTEDLRGGTIAAKTSPPLGDRSGAADIGAPEELGNKATEELDTGATEELGAGTPEELVPDDRLLQRNQDQSQNKGGVQQQENKKGTHRRVTRAASSSSSSSLSTKATIAPAEKGQKYSVKDKNKQQKDRAY